jgi:hypothetical protein
MQPGIENPMPKLMVAAFGLMVKVAVTAGLSFMPGEDAMAVIVVVEVMEMGTVYCVELCVGMVPLVV